METLLFSYNLTILLTFCVLTLIGTYFIGFYQGKKKVVKDLAELKSMLQTKADPYEALLDCHSEESEKWN